MSNINCLIISFLFSSFIYYFVSIFGDICFYAIFTMYLSLFISSFFILRCFQKGRENIFSINFFLYMIFLYIIPGMVFSSENLFPFFLASYPPDDVFRASLVIFTFLVFFCAGHYLSDHSRGSENEISYKDFANWQIPTKWATNTISILMLVSLLGVIAYGESVIFVRRGDQSFVTDVDDLPEFTIISVLITEYASFYALILSSIKIFKYKNGLKKYHSLIVPLFFFLLSNNPLSLNRSVVFSYAICAIVVFFDTARRRTKIIYATVYVVSLYTLFPMLNQLARGAPGQGLIPDPITYVSEGGGDFDGLQSTINVKLWIDHDGLQLGRQLLSALFFFIPRSIWEGKAHATGSLAADYVGYTFDSVSSPLPSEFYADFGILGVAIGGFLAGRLVPILDYSLHRARLRGAPVSMMMYGMMAGMSVAIWRGSLIGCVPLFTFSVAFAWALTRLEQRPTPTIALTHPDAELPTA